MKAEVYWLKAFGPGRLGVMPRPRGNDWLEDEVGSLASEGVELVVSLLMPDEASELGLEREEVLCEAHGVEYVSFPISDRGTPVSMAETRRLAQTISDVIAAGRRAVIHCRAGIGRSALIAACVLILSGMPARAAFEVVTAARGCEVPDTSEQVEWAASFERHCCVAPD